MILLTYSLNEQCYDPTINTESLLDKAQQEILEVTNYLQKKNYTHIKDEVRITMEYVESIHERHEKGASVFGGGSNLKTSVKNIFEIYKPDIIAVHTTCLSETIGDDVGAFIQDMDIEEGKYVVHSHTPSYVGSHITGYGNMIAGFIKYLSKSTGKTNGKLNIIPGFVNPGDMRELKRLLELMGIKFIMLPDTSGVLDAPMLGTYTMYPAGGTTITAVPSPIGKAAAGVRMPSRMTMLDTTKGVTTADQGSRVRRARVNPTVPPSRPRR